MTPEETATIVRTEAEEEVAPVEATLEAEPEEQTEQDFNPLGNIEGWSAFECSSGPFGFRG
jgi:hypothetical protein